MKIALRSKGLVLVSAASPSTCRPGCDGTVAICELGICRNLEKHIGPHVWNLVGFCEDPSSTDVLLLADGKIYRTIPYVPHSCHWCDWRRDLCFDYCFDYYCAGKGEEALCHMLGGFFDGTGVAFKEVHK